VRRLLLVAVAGAALVVPGAAGAVPCSPLNCSASQFTFAHGALLGVRLSPDKPLRVIDLRTGATKWRLPSGVVVGDTVVHQDGGLITWFNAARGTRSGDAALQARGAFVLVGASQDAARAVLARTQTRSTTFAIVSRAAAQHVVKLGGRNWSFDALNGHSLFLIQQLQDGYQVRMYDLSTNRLQKEPLKDPRESALIQGVAFARASSANGRYVFTLYVGTNGDAMVHELDTTAGSAHCIDLPGTGNLNAAVTWALVPDVDSGTLWATSPGYGRVVAIDVAAHTVRLRYAFQRANWNGTPGTAVLAPDGEHIAFTDAQHVWLATPATRKVVQEPAHVAIALGFAPDQSALWVVGERSRVSRLTPLRWR